MGEKRMCKLNLICWLVAIGIIICGSLYLSYLKNALQAEKTNNKQLVLTLEKRNNDVLEISRKKKELEAAVKADKSGFDWLANIADSGVIEQLRKECVSCPE